MLVLYGKRCFKNHLKNRSKVEGKTDIVCDTVKKCLDCSRVITGKYVNSHKCGYNECNNCNKYVGKNGYNQIKPDERSKFMKWYQECVSENYVFDFKKEILEYCQSDIDILRIGIMKLREDFIQQENIDPLRYITIASVCMTIYRSNYMPKKTIATIPEYVKTDNFSKTSIMWLNYMSNGDSIKHALNGGEKELTIDNKNYKVDGFCEETNTVYKFYGCFWHGCPNCYRPNIINTKNQ